MATTKKNRIACRGDAPVFHNEIGSKPKQVRQRCRSGLTLLELMVVLVILAIVATVALQTLQPQVESQRFQSATHLLNEIRSSTIGPTEKYQVDGTPLISGFVADIGRLPLAESQSASDSSNAILGELWQVESSLALNFPYQFRPGPIRPVDYSQVRIPCGWRSAYLHLPVGSTRLVDPWGRDLEVEFDQTGQSRQVRILAPPMASSDNTTELSADLSAGKVEVTGKLLLDNPSSSTVEVALLVPDPETSLTTLAVRDDEDEHADSFVFRDIPIGLRAIVIDFDGKRRIKYVQVPHGGLTLCIDLQTPRSDSPN